MVVGLQASGKTTFAAALWHLLDGREVPTALAKGKHEGDFRYLEEIAQSWCEGWRVERTKSEEIQHVRINLRHPSSMGELALEFTDLSGESFEGAFARRLCMPSLVELAKAAEGMLLFVSADRLVDSVTILDALPDEDLQDEAEERTEIPWDPAKTPHQVQLVDFLEALRLRPFEMLPCKVAVVISAWDLTDAPSPDAWLAEKMPLLDQYLRNADGARAVRVYGVSAQGGQLSTKGHGPGPDQDRLLTLRPPSKRIQIVGQDVAEHDLTRPLLWLSKLDENA